MNTQENFIHAIHLKQWIRINFFSMEKGIPFILVCIPLDFGPTEHSYYGESLFHCMYFNGDGSIQVVRIRPKLVNGIEILEQSFNPEEFIDRDTIRDVWSIKREWGKSILDEPGK